MYLGTLRSFLRCIKCTNNQVERYSSSIDLNRILKPYLNLSDTDITQFLRTNKLRHLESDQLDESLQMLKSFGYDSRDFMSYPNLLKRSAKILKVQHKVLAEAGFCNLSAKIISNFRSVIHKKIKVLKSSNYIPVDVNVPETLISYLNPKPEDFCISEFSDNDIFAQIHSVIVKRYLMWRLEATSFEITQLFRIYVLKFKSLEYLCENIDIALNLGYAKKKLLSCGYLLSNNPEYAKYVLREIPNLAGADMRKAMKMYPKLVTVQPKNYHQTYKLLKDAQFSDRSIQLAINIFTLAPKTIKFRLDEITAIPELNVLFSSPGVLKLIVHHNRTRSRLSFLQQMQLKCASLCLLGADMEDKFIQHLKKGRDENTITEVLNLLSNLLNCDKKVARFNLRKHPYYLNVPLLNIQATVKHLQTKFNNESIIKVLPLVLYPIDKIDRALGQISTKECMYHKRLSDSKTLNLVLYHIEKDYNFSGNGIWT